MISKSSDKTRQSLLSYVPLAYLVLSCLYLVLFHFAFSFILLCCLVVYSLVQALSYQYSIKK